MGKNTHRAKATLVFVACFSLYAAGRSASDAPVTAKINVQASDLLVKPPGSNWPSYNGDYTGRRYSSLKEINTANVRHLRAEWVFHSPNSSLLEVTPVVVNGIMLVGSANDVFALEAVDALTGDALWHFNTGQRIHASPMSFAVGGKQYVAIAAGSDIFAFALPGYEQ